MKRRIFYSIICLFLLQAPKAVSADTLLGTFGVQAGPITYLVPIPNHVEATGITFGFGFDGAPSYNSADPIGSYIRDDRIGMDFTIPISPGNNSASRSFDSNSAGFSDVVGRLVNGVDESVAVTQIYLAQDGSVATPAPTTTLFFQESDHLLSSPDLAGSDISRIDLTADTLSYTFQNQGANRQLFFSFDYRFEVYGNAAIPEPGSSSLLLLLSGVCLYRRRRSVR